MIVMNRGAAPVQLKNKKVLRSGQQAEVSDEEGKKLLNYKSIVDAKTLLPEGSAARDLAEENAKLKKELAEKDAKGDAPKAPEAQAPDAAPQAAAQAPAKGKGKGKGK